MGSRGGGVASYRRACARAGDSTLSWTERARNRAAAVAWLRRFHPKWSAAERVDAVQRDIDRIRYMRIRPTQWTVHWHAWQQAEAGWRARAARVSAGRAARARRVAELAGLHGASAPVQIRDCLVAWSYGQPWEGVNYDLVRRARLLFQQASRPHQLVDSWVARTMPR